MLQPGSLSYSGKPHVKSSPISLSHSPMQCLDASFSDEHIIDSSMAFRRKKTTPGIDRIDPRTYFDLMIKSEEQRNELRKLVRSSSFRPSPYIAKAIPKGNGKFRIIAIPTAQDKLTQKILIEAISPRLTREFHPESFAYQSGKTTLQAALRAIQKGMAYPYVVRVDLKSFFDMINREKLIWMLDQKGIETEHLKLMRRFIYAPLVDSGRTIWKCSGVAQGGPLSPVLANLYLTPLDWWMQKMNIPFVRYADDILAFTSTRREGLEVLDAVDRFCHRVLKLSVNREKSEVQEFEGVPFLGFTLGARGVELPVTLHGRLQDLMAPVVEESTAVLVLEHFKKRLNQILGIANYYRYTANYRSEGIPILLDQVDLLTYTFINGLPIDCVLGMINGFTLKDHIQGQQQKTKRQITKLTNSTGGLLESR